MQPWHDQEAFWQDMAAVMFTAERLAAAPDDVTDMIRLLGLTPGARVLDLCTGPGRHAVELARRGFAVTGVDRTEVYLNQAREAAATSGVDVELVEADMREFVRESAFDAAINMFSSFGYFADEQENLQVAVNVRRSLAPGRVALFDIMGKEVLARTWQEHTWTEIDGMLFLEHSQIVDAWSRVRSRWILIREGKRREFSVELRVYSAAEFRALLLSAGFARVDVYGSLAGAPYDPDARRLVAVART